ncbi:hypothetical protein [Staphylococcus epidermidis]|uniref:hypothetical protein n=1 Tax=Staphylococcus epidermidis TaxID=1282 RepID=UPI002DBD66E4|nr:hypothetical protein [Staphylococcus epidermidis]MEB7693443.1 hypothetical protein [Staphylococcus epidermidis]
MKHLKKYFHLYILALLVFIFCFSVVIETIFKIDFKDCLMISISFLGLFATFGGAYLGAKISGNNALKLSNRELFIKNTKELFNLISDYKKSSLNTLQEIKDNVIICSELEKIPYLEVNLKTFETTYNELKDTYLRIKLLNQYVFLSEKLIEEIKPPSQLKIVSYPSTIWLVNETNENGIIRKVLDEDFYDYQDTLSKVNENFHKIIKNIDTLRDELIEKI